MRRTIRSSSEIDALFRTGSKATNKFVLIMSRATPEERGPEGRVAFVAGKRLGGAVVRNRAKRVLRAAAARLGAPWEGYDVVMVARPSTGITSEPEADQLLSAALHRAGVTG